MESPKETSLILKEMQKMCTHLKNKRWKVINYYFRKSRIGGTLNEKPPI